VYNDIKIFSGSSNPALAQSMTDRLAKSLGKLKLNRFSDGEIELEVQESVRGQDVYIIQSLCSSAKDTVNDHMMELLIAVDAFKRSSAGQITAVIPYYGYARQDRQIRPRTPITAKLVADLLTTAGVNRVVSIDLHAGQIQGFFSVPFDPVYASSALRDAFSSLRKENVVVVSPDTGGVERARYYARKLGASLAIIDKRRPKPNQAEIMNLIGDVEGKVAVIVDDMVDTAGTLTLGAQAVMDHGAKEVMALATHPVFSGPAISRIQESVLSRVIVTDTIPLNSCGRQCEKIHVVSVATILAEAIERMHGSMSVSSMFHDTISTK